MSRAGWAAQLKQRADADRSRRSARLGRILRSVLIDPAAGFTMIGRGAHVEAASYVIAALGTAGLMSVWLKFGGLVGRRTVGRADFEWGQLIAAFALAAVFGLLAQFVWAWIMHPVAGRLGEGTATRTLRAVWGVALAPPAIALVALVPLDLIVVGPETFATERLGGADATWAAISIAVGAVLVAWWIYVLARGVEIAATVRPLRATVAPILGVGTLLACVFGLRFLLVFLAEWTA